MFYQTHSHWLAFRHLTGKKTSMIIMISSWSKADVSHGFSMVFPCFPKKTSPMIGNSSKISDEFRQVTEVTAAELSRDAERESEDASAERFIGAAVRAAQLGRNAGDPWGFAHGFPWISMDFVPLNHLFHLFLDGMFHEINLPC